MAALIAFFLNVVASLFKSKSRLEEENAALRHQLIVLQRKVRARVHFTNSDCLFFITDIAESDFRYTQPASPGTRERIVAMPEAPVVQVGGNLMPTYPLSRE